MHPKPRGKTARRLLPPFGLSSGTPSRLLYRMPACLGLPARLASRLSAATALCLLSGLSHAALTLHTDAGLFSAASGAVLTDSFNDLPAGILASPLNRSVGSASYSAAVEPDTSNASVGAPVPPGEFYVAGSAADAWLSTNTANDTLRFFNLAGLRAIGGLFFGSDVDGLFQAGVDIDLVATDSGGSFSHTLRAATFGSFVGFVSDATLVSLSLRAVQPPQGNAWISANNLQLAQAVPEPGSAALALLALTGLALVSPGRRTRAAC